jgi:hypothetical protein
MNMLAAVSLLATMRLGDQDKLETLRRLDQFRHWRSLDDKRYCLGCSKLISGRQIQVIGGTRGNGPLRIICPTQRCPAIPMDWVLPTDEVLANNSRPRAERTELVTATSESRARENRIAASLRKFATHFHRPA